MPYAGGRALPTPFGTIYSSNLTPDLETGIGTWSEEAFRRAIHEGVDREGRQLYPAFPYDHFTKATDEDIHALYAFLMSIPAIRNVIPANQLLFPFSRARTGSSEVLAGQVSAGDLDTAIVMMESASRPATSLIGRIIATLDVAIVQSRRRPLVREPIRLAGLAKHAWILNPNGCRYRAGLENAMGERDRSLHVVIDTYGTEVQLRMVASGRGLGLVPLSITIKKDWT